MFLTKSPNHNWLAVKWYINGSHYVDFDFFFFFLADSNKQSLAGFAVQPSALFFLLYSMLHKFWVQIICLTFSTPLYAPQIKMWQKLNYLIKSKLRFLSLSYTPYVIPEKKKIKEKEGYLSNVIYGLTFIINTTKCFFLENKVETLIYIV